MTLKLSVWTVPSKYRSVTMQIPHSDTLPSTDSSPNMTIFSLFVWILAVGEHAVGGARVARGHGASAERGSGGKGRQYGPAAQDSRLGQRLVAHHDLHYVRTVSVAQNHDAASKNAFYPCHSSLPHAFANPNIWAHAHGPCACAHIFRFFSRQPHDEKKG